MFFTTIINGADGDSTSPIRKSTEPLDNSTVKRVRTMLHNDYERDVQDLLESRMFLRKISNYSAAVGNALVYTGAGLSAAASGVKLVSSGPASCRLLFPSTACLAAHISFIGIAKYSAREEAVRENLLEKLAQRVGFRVTPEVPVVIDDCKSSN